ncbi:MAG: VCBS repeat-containing protein, partial [Candidatus Thermoplasmatota archaeon]|nr:VCBS repeat-containing protein [Candidatus Thermoplasmatota archaeon]
MIGILTGAPGSVRGEQLAPGTEWFETEEGVRSLAVGNFDNRNGVDIVTASGENDSVTVFLNNGNGGFEEINYGTGTQPTSVVVGDVDNDNKQDIITSNWGNNSISVLNNSGLGIYPVNNEYSVGPNPTSVALGDLDGVNGPDIVATIGNDSIAIRYNDGAGGFGGQVDYYSVGGNPLSVRLGDLNGNGKLDIVTANRDDSDVTILINDGTGQFPLNFSMETAIRPNSVFLADINGDRNTDIITTGSSFVSVIRNNGVGFEERMDYMVGAKSSAVVAGDVDNDKDLDIITTNDNDHSVTILYNNGIGRFSKSIDYAVGTFPKDLVLTDLDADSDLDIITVNFCDRNYHPFGTPYVSMLMNNGMGSFGCGRRDYELDNRPNELIIDNLNSELYGLDVLISNGNKVALWDDNYVGILGNLSDVNAFNPITSLAVGDVDGINGKDIITLHKVQSKIKVMMNDGNRSFAFPINYSLNGSLDDMAFISDTERIVVVNTDDNNISVYTTVGGVIAGPTNVSTINGPESVYVGNLDKANNLDVVVYNSKRISVLLTDGAGDFLASTDYGFGLDELSLADIDDDGDDDIIGVLTNNDNLMIYLNVGLGVF